MGGFSNLYHSLVYWQDRNARRTFNIRVDRGKMLVTAMGWLEETTTDLLGNLETERPSEERNRICDLPCNRHR